MNWLSQVWQAVSTPGLVSGSVQGYLKKKKEGIDE